jgi:uncharacterized coiled-coil DUF342 family protein
MARSGDWELYILRKLEERNREEFHKHQEIYKAYDQLRLVNERLNKDVVKLQYEKDTLQENLDSKLTSSDSKGGDAGGLGKRVEELKQKLASSEEARLEKNEKYTTLLEKNFEDERDLTVTRNKLKEAEKTLQIREATCEGLQVKVASLSEQVQKLKNQSSTAQQRLEKSQKENDSLREKVNDLQKHLLDAKDSRREAEKNAHRKELREQIQKAEGGTPDRPKMLRSNSSKEVSTSVRSASSKRTVSETVESPRRSSLAPHTSTPSVKPEVPTTIWDAHDSDVTALCFSNYGNYVATGGSDKLVRIWPVNDKGEVTRDEKSRTQLSGCKASILSLQFDDQDQTILGASNDQTARVWQLDNKKQLVRLKGHNDKVSAARFCERSTKVVTGSLDRTVKIWDWKTEKSLCTLFAGYSCTDVLVGRNPQWATLVTSHNDKQVRFWDLRTNTPNPIVLGGKITSLDQSPDGRYLLCCCMDDTLRIIDMNQKSLYKTLKWVLKFGV